MPKIIIELSPATIKALASGAQLVDIAAPASPAPAAPELSPVPFEDKYFSKGNYEDAIAAIDSDSSLNPDQRAYLLGKAENTLPHKADLEKMVRELNPYIAAQLDAFGIPVTQFNVDEFIWRHPQFQSQSWRDLQLKSGRSGPSQFQL